MKILDFEQGKSKDVYTPDKVIEDAKKSIDKTSCCIVIIQSLKDGSVALSYSYTDMVTLLGLLEVGKKMVEIEMEVQTK